MTQYSVCSIEEIEATCPHCYKVYSKGSRVVVMECDSKLKIVAHEPSTCCGVLIQAPRLFSKDYKPEYIKQVVIREQRVMAKVYTLDLNVLGVHALSVMLSHTSAMVVYN